MVESDLAMVNGRGNARFSEVQRREGCGFLRGRSCNSRAAGGRRGSLSVSILRGEGGASAEVAGARGNEARDKILLFRLRSSK